MFTRVLTAFDSDVALTDADKAGFVAYLALLAGDDVVLPEAAVPFIERFCALAGLHDDDDVATRQASTDAFFTAHPLRPSLLALLREEADGDDVSARTLLGGERHLKPVQRTREPGTIPGGALGMLAALSLKTSRPLKKKRGDDE